MSTFRAVVVASNQLEYEVAIADSVGKAAAQLAPLIDNDGEIVFRVNQVDTEEIHGINLWQRNLNAFVVEMTTQG